MMGQPAPNVRAPVVKGTNCILALSEAETRRKEAMPCIRCGTCLSVCPCGLPPLELYSRIRNEELDSAVDIGLLDCVSCGSCSYVCPSNIPLIQHFNYAKGKLTNQQRDKHRQEETKRLAKQRDERMERIAAAKREAMARRKAEREAKKKREAEKAAAEAGASAKTSPPVPTNTQPQKLEAAES